MKQKWVLPTELLATSFCINCSLKKLFHCRDDQRRVFFLSLWMARKNRLKHNLSKRKWLWMLGPPGSGVSLGVILDTQFMLEEMWLGRPLHKHKFFLPVPFMPGQFDSPHRYSCLDSAREVFSEATTGPNTVVQTVIFTSEVLTKKLPSAGYYLQKSTCIGLSCLRDYL